MRILERVLQPASLRPRPPHAEILAQCGECQRLIRWRAFLGLLDHLTDSHNLSADDAVTTVNWILDKMREHIRTKHTA